MKKAGPHPPFILFAILPHNFIQAGFLRPASEFSPLRSHIGIAGSHALLAFGTNLAIEFSAPVS
jgi:hypothetical protein